MKLRNKKTGKVYNVVNESIKLSVGDRSAQHTGYYTSLTELNSEWEDVSEEPKTFFTIYYDGTISEFKDGDDDQIRDMKAIGNYFESLEEAEKAVEKLRAWKRLKDKGFVFKGINEGDGSIKTGLSKGVSLNDCEDFYCDMVILFGGEE